MAITLTTHTSVQQTAGTGTATTGAVNTTAAAGSCLVVVATARVNAITISDNQSNSYTALTDRAGGTALGRLHYCQNANTNASHTFSVAGTFGSASIAVLVFAGANTSGGQDQQSTGAANATSVQPGSITPAENNEVVVTLYAGVNTSSDVVAINGGFTITDTVYLANSDMAVSAAYLIQTTATAANPTWSNLVTSGGSNVACIASFKVLAAAGSAWGPQISDQLFRIVYGAQ